MPNRESMCANHSRIAEPSAFHWGNAASLAAGVGQVTSNAAETSTAARVPSSRLARFFLLHGHPRPSRQVAESLNVFRRKE